MRVSECMTRDVRMISPDATIGDAARLMADTDTGILPISENDKLIGMITDRDIAIRGVARGKDPETTKVRHVMSAEVKYCFDDDELEDVLQNMGDLQVRRLPVISRAKRLVGIISLGDLAANGAPEAAGDALSQISQPGGDHSQTAH